MAVLIVLVVVLALAVIFGLWVAGVYNGLVRLRNLVQEAWRQIDVELGRRHDLIPNLVETVRAYATHERQALDSVVAARAAARGAVGSVEQQAVAEGTLSAALGGLFAVAEAYPDLKANQNFLALQAELTETEDRVAAGRRFYNANVRELNTRVESFPSNLFASTFGFARAEYFEVVDLGQREVPQIRLASPQGGAAGAIDPLRAVPPATSASGEYTVPGSAQSPYGNSPQSPYGNPPRP
ncbi:MAG: LemA protein [Actinomycetota bacterium]|nr:LemA protein [Actinomycetota bacterium]